MDGGYLRTEDIEGAHGQGVALFVPPKPARNAGQSRAGTGAAAGRQRRPPGLEGTDAERGRSEDL